MCFDPLGKKGSAICRVQILYSHLSFPSTFTRLVLIHLNLNPNFKDAIQVVEEFCFSNNSSTFISWQNFCTSIQVE